MNKAKKIIYILLFVIFAAVFAISAYVVGDYFIDAARQRNMNKELVDIKEKAEPTATVTTPYTDPETNEPETILPEYTDLFLKNPDLVGWITIPGTKVDYPVLQSPESPDYYLKHNFEKESTSRGAIYAREVCDINRPSDNITIYGHNMRDGTMFKTLISYQKREFWQEHRTFTFDTLTQHHTYEVMSVFKTSGYADEGFPYHLFVDASTPEEFDEFVDTVKSLELFETGLSAEYGDKLICLSTCEYSRPNGRLVVVAKRIS